MRRKENHRRSVSIDTTHIEANTIKKTPERLMKHLGKKIIKTYTEETGKTLEDMPEAPAYKEIEDHKEAKAEMKEYLETVIGYCNLSLPFITSTMVKSLKSLRHFS